MMTDRKLARSLQVGDRIVWCGRKCRVIGVVGPQREFHQHRTSMRVDLAVPGLPDAKGVHYWSSEEVERWAHIPQEKDVDGD